MADEKPTKNEDELQEIAESVPGPDEYPEGQAEELEERIEDGQETPLDEATVAALETTEKLSDSAPAQAWDAGVKAIERSIEATSGPSAEAMEQAQGEHHHDDVTVFMGREFPYSIYTSVFFALGILTLIEVVLAEIISSDVKIPLLLGIAIAKALLVVIFYMHLNKDSRVFALTLALPVGLALLATLYLLGVPSTGY